MNREKRWVMRILAGLWIFDGFLQLQPAMFTKKFVDSVLIPATVGQPEFFQHIMVAAEAFWNRAPVVSDLGVATGQVIIGALLLAPRPRWQQWGLYLSVAWGTMVWIIGEGMGGIMTSNASLFSGLPGSALLYVGLSLVLMGEPRYYDYLLRWGIAGFWGIGAVYQTLPFFGGRGTLTSILSSAAQTPSPQGLTDPIRTAAIWVAHAPQMSNAILLAVWIALSVWTRLARRVTTSWVVASLAVLFVMWWFGMDFGVFGGVGTDPNTAPVVGLAVIGRAWHSARVRRRLRAPVTVSGPLVWFESRSRRSTR